MAQTLFIVNAASNGGAGIRAWEAFVRSFPDDIPAEDVRFTERQGHAHELARVAAGRDLVVAVGGDGTVGEVISGIMECPEPRPALAVLPSGTGNDIARHVGCFPLPQAIAALTRPHRGKFDLIRIDCRDGAGRPVSRYAFLYGTAGFSTLVKFKPWMKRFLGVGIGSYLSAILALIDFRPPAMTVRVGDAVFDGRLWMIVVSNSEFAAGGTMRMAPDARTDDGEMNLTVIPARPKPLLLATVLPKVPSGRHTESPGVSYFAASEDVQVDADRAVLVEIDGDVFGFTPARFSMCPGAIEIVCG